MIQPEIVINVRGGVIKEVYSSGELADLVVVDWDAEDSAGRCDGVRLRIGCAGVTKQQAAFELQIGQPPLHQTSVVRHLEVVHTQQPPVVPDGVALKQAL